MTNADDRHFEEYRDQTRVKHLILQSYLKPYFDIVSKQTDSLVYLDGFAGRGLYEDPHAPAGVSFGSPLRAMRLFASVPELRHVRTVLIENNSLHFPFLSDAVATIVREHKELPSPELFFEKFSIAAHRVIRELPTSGTHVPAVFAFIDPCGVEDVVFEVIVEILQRPFAECFVFFNYEGVNRIVGAAELNGSSPTLSNLLGGDDAVRRLLARVAVTRTPDQREEAIVGGYCSEVSRTVSPIFVAPFRVESEARRSTSHYLLHFTKNATAFRIMKDIMWERGRSDDACEGQLGLLQRSDTSDGLFLRDDLAEQEKAVVAYLKSKNGCTVGDVVRLAERAGDLFSGKSYKECLKRLEKRQSVRVFLGDKRTPSPAESRKMLRGQPTLADHLWVIPTTDVLS